MRNFLLIFLLNFKDMWRNHKFIFILINLFMLCSFTFFIISYDSINYELYNNSIETYITNTYTFNFDNDINIEDKYEKLDKLIKEEKNIRAIFFYYDNAPEKILYDEHGRPIDYKEHIYPIYYGQLLENSVSSGRWFSKEEFETGAKVVIVPNYDFAVKFEQGRNGEPVPHYEIGDKYVINGEEYTVIGETTSAEYVYMIPFNAFNDKNLLSSGVNISVIEKLSESDNKKFISKVNSYLDTSLKRSALIRDSQGERLLRVIYYVILNITVINLAFIYSYLINQRKEMIGLFKLYGLRKDRCALYLFLEYFIWYLFDFILACIISNIYILYTINKNVNFLNKMLRFLSFKEYIYIFIAYSLIYFICFFPSIIRFIEKNQDITLITEGGETNV